MLPHSDPPPYSSARRRLVRGAFGVPAALALHNGSALAAASNLRCVRAAADAALADPPGHTDAPDQFVRVQLYAQTDVGGNVVAWYLSGASVEAVLFGYRKATNAFLGAGRWLQVVLQSGGGATLGSTVLYAQPASTALGPKWIALRFMPRDNGGYVDVVGVIDGSTSGSAVTGSCWSSFVGITSL
jgi:hypothetical protein